MSPSQDAHTGAVGLKGRDVRERVRREDGARRACHVCEALTLSESGEAAAWRPLSTVPEGWKSSEQEVGAVWGRLQ